MLPIFDAHLHLCCRQRLDEFPVYLRRTGIDKAVCLSLPDLHCGTFNDVVLAAKAAFPSQLFALAALDYRGLTGHRQKPPQVVSLPRQVEQAWAAGFDGLKLWIGKPSFQAQLGFGPDHPEVAEALQTACMLDMPVVIHAADPPQFWLDNEGQTRKRLGIGTGLPYHDYEFYIRQALEIPARHPRLRIVFAHLLFLAADLLRAARLLDDHPYVCFDLSPGLYMYPALASRRDRSREFFAVYRQRLLFGSDGFWFPPHVRYLPQADLNENCRRARRLLHFLTSHETMPNPFAYDRDGRRSVGCLGLPDSVLRSVLCTSAVTVFGQAPRRLEAPAGEAM